MKETIIRSKKFPHLILQLFDYTDFGMLGEDAEGKDKDFFTDNVSYAYEVYRLLQEADKRKSFDKLKGGNDLEDREEIFI